MIKIIAFTVFFFTLALGALLIASAVADNIVERGRQKRKKAALVKCMHCKRSYYIMYLDKFHCGKFDRDVKGSDFCSWGKRYKPDGDEDE